MKHHRNTFLARFRRDFLTAAPPGERGQAMTEFAIAFPLQLFLTFGIMQLILLYISALMVNYAAYRAARAAVVEERDSGLSEEAAREAARIVLAPLSGPPIGPGDVLPAPVEIPGRGPLQGSDYAAVKTRVFVPPPDLDAEELTVAVEFSQKLIFPVVDGLFAAFFRTDEMGEDAMAFGTLDTGSDLTNFTNAPSVYEHPSLGRVRYMPDGSGGGAYHFVLVREATVYKRQFAHDKILVPGGP